MKRFLKTLLNIFIILTLCIMMAFIVNILPINTFEKNVFFNLKFQNYTISFIE